MISTMLMVYFLIWLSSNLLVLLVEYIEEVYFVNKNLMALWYFLNMFSMYSVSLASMRFGGYNSSYLFYYFMSLCQNPNSLSSASPLPNPFISLTSYNSFRIFVYFMASSLIFLSSYLLLSSSYFLLFWIISLNYFFRFSGPPTRDAAKS